MKPHTRLTDNEIGQLPKDQLYEYMNREGIDRSHMIPYVIVAALLSICACLAMILMLLSSALDPGQRHKCYECRQYDGAVRCNYCRQWFCWPCFQKHEC